MSLRAFIDESSANRGDDQQEYLICAVLLPDSDCGEARENLRPLLLPGQVKFHWTSESSSRQREIVRRIVELDPMNVIVAHLDARAKKTERYRRKCLETLYYEFAGMLVHDLVLESRTTKQDSDDRSHIVALQGQGLDKRIRIGHMRGGDEPLLWIADAVLGSINAAYLGDDFHLNELRSTLVLETRTPESKVPRQDERP